VWSVLSLGGMKKENARKRRIAIPYGSLATSLYRADLLGAYVARSEKKGMMRNGQRKDEDPLEY